jgi:hypothetical protein
MTATTGYPYTAREIERTAVELQRMLDYALWAVDHRDLAAAIAREAPADVR